MASSGDVPIHTSLVLSSFLLNCIKFVLVVLEKYISRTSTSVTVTLHVDERIPSSSVSVPSSPSTFTIPFTDAVIVASPFAIAVTTPSDTVATVSSLLAQVTVLSTASSGVTVALSVSVLCLTISVSVLFNLIPVARIGLSGGVTGSVSPVAAAGMTANDIAIAKVKISAPTRRKKSCFIIVAP